MSIRFPDLLIGWLVATAVGVSIGPPKGPSLRICADPDNLPSSNLRREGWENRIADLLASDLKLEPLYVWRDERRGNVRQGLEYGACDVMIGAQASTLTVVVRKDDPALASRLDAAVVRRRAEIARILER